MATAGARRAAQDPQDAGREQTAKEPGIVRRHHEIVPRRRRTSVRIRCGARRSSMRVLLPDHPRPARARSPVCSFPSRWHRRFHAGPCRRQFPPIEAGEATVAAPRVPIPDPALVEGPQSRDPFRAFALTPAAPPPDARPRKAHRIPVDQLKLVGAGHPHRDFPGRCSSISWARGYIVTQGEPWPLPETTAPSASLRVDRIREGDMVLVREDVADLRAPAVTRPHPAARAAPGRRLRSSRKST